MTFDYRSLFVKSAGGVPNHLTPTHTLGPSRISSTGSYDTSSSLVSGPQAAVTGTGSARGTHKSTSTSFNNKKQHTVRQQATATGQQQSSRNSKEHSNKAGGGYRAIARQLESAS